MNLKERLAPGLKSLDTVREFLDVPRPASMSDMLKKDVAVRFVGFHCFGTTSGPGSDEAYFTFGVVPLDVNKKNTLQTRIFEDVDEGESTADSIELYRGLPFGTVITVVLSEHDQGDPNKFRDNVEKAVDFAADKTVEALAAIPVVGTAAAVVAKIAFIVTGPAITDSVNKLLGTEDDLVGVVEVQITAADMRRHSREQRKDFEGLKAHVESPLISDEGASYKAYFDVIEL